MLAEIDERSATGDIARVFEDVRRLWGVPYVSAIHRHMATRPGLLEWAWAAVGPAFRSGAAQEAGWWAADGAALAPLDPIPRAALQVWGLDEAAMATARSVAEGFVRVAPVNMMFAGLVKALLGGKAPGGAPDRATPWSPPAPLPVPPAMVAPEALDAPARDVLFRFATPSNGRPFVPGLYRMLAHWPGLLAHLATVLPPRLAAAEAAAACDDIRAGIDAAVPGVLATLPPLPAAVPPRPGPGETAHFLAIGGTYRKTSPELVLLGRLIRDALPKAPG